MTSRGAGNGGMFDRMAHYAVGIVLAVIIAVDRFRS
jgi:hypothetical protein